MGWSIGYDDKWERDIGYGVPAFCDHPDCGAEINRGLSYVCCDEQPYGGAQGCGLYFCQAHHDNKCGAAHHKIKPTPDHPDWIAHKLLHDSWREWREAYPDRVNSLRAPPALPDDGAR